MNLAANSSMRGTSRQRRMATAKVRIKANGEFSSIPVIIPDIEELRRFAHTLHKAGKPWKGEAFGWEAEYNPERSEKPLDSNMSFTPADPLHRRKQRLVLLAYVGTWA